MDRTSLPSPGMRLKAIERLKKEGCFELAIKAIDELLASPSLDGDILAEARVIRGEALIRSARLDEAESELRKIKEYSHVAARALAARGVIAASRNRWTEAT